VTRNSIRFIVFLAIIAVAGIATTQIYWVHKAYELNEQHFSHRVLIALKAVADRLTLERPGQVVSLETINRPAPNYYTMDFSAPVDPELLEQHLIAEFRNQNITVNFEYGIFECADDSLLHGNYVNMSKLEDIRRIHYTPAPGSNFYIGILFPVDKQTFMYDEMAVWIFFTVLMLVVFTFFGYTIMTIVKQKRLSEIKNDFVNNMTHEFKTPIATIGLSSEVLMKDDIASNPERLKHYARIISEENKRLKMQVEAVLQASVLDSRHPHLNKATVDIHALIINILPSFQVRAHDAGGNVAPQLDATATVVYGDEVHLTNIFYSLLDNSLKYCDKTPDIQIVTANANNGIQIAIRDNGKGIPKQSLKHIFEKFYRVPSGNIHDVKGFGIGLFYVKNIVKLHKGHIMVESREKEGATFTIWLPLKK
jgi:two-component system, OmpR family, phosphate regulon sensor histidine kinase PhoR